MKLHFRSGAHLLIIKFSIFGGQIQNISIRWLQLPTDDLKLMVLLNDLHLTRQLAYGFQPDGGIESDDDH